MRGKDFLDKMELVDSAFLEEADAKPKRKKQSYLKWGALAACLCLVIAGAFTLIGSDFFLNPPVSTDGTSSTDEAAYGFVLDTNNSTVYFPITFDERVRYGLVPDGTVGLTPESTYRITQNDLGERMGTVASCGDEALLGCTVYHFASYPDYDSICIVETINGYAFYTANCLNASGEIGQSSDTAMAAYGLPESVEKVEILTPDWQPLFSIEDEETLSGIFEILSGKENIGLEANERRFAQAWYDAYGNEDVYYSEKSGTCVYKEVPTTSGGPITYTDDEGNTIVEVPQQDTSLYDAAHALWTNGERLIQITTNRGFQFYIDYFPAISTFIWDGYYVLSDSEAQELNALLNINIK